MKYEVTEVCPNCDRENTLNWDTEKDGYKIFCPNCGTRMMLCDACTHADDNPNHRCDWSRKDGCFRAPIKPRRKRFVINIQWATDEEPIFEQLPQRMEIPIDMSDLNEISEHITRVTGFCHNGFSITDEEN